MSNKSSESELRYGAALTIALVGLLLPTILVVFLVKSEWKANDISTIVGLFTSVVGTLVGAFLGVQVGSAGKEKADAEKQKAQDLANRALGALPPDDAKRIMAP